MVTGPAAKGRWVSESDVGYLATASTVQGFENDVSRPRESGILQRPLRSIE